MFPQDLPELASHSAKVGQNLSLTQGAGGNTSIKEREVLYVKASGTRLAEADTRDIFIPVDLTGLKKALNQGVICNEQDLVLGGSQLRASIETPLHAVIPQRVVVHIHSVAALAFAVLKGGPPEELKRRLNRFSWAWVPYAKPGWPLTWELKKTLGENPSVWILQNHGLIVAAESVSEAFTLLFEVESALSDSSTQGELSTSDNLDLGEMEGEWRASVYPFVNSLAKIVSRFEWATGGVICPDQAVFLGERIPGVEHPTELSTVDAHAKAVLIRGVGVAVRKSVSTAADELLMCLSLTLARLGPHSSVNYLSGEAVAELLDWDAEKYRQKLAV